MKFKVIFSIVYSVILFSNCQIQPSQKAKDILWKNCYVCHAPSDYLNGIAQDEMTKKLGVKGLRKFMINDFNKKGKSSIEEHNSIKLTRKEIRLLVGNLDIFYRIP